MNMDLLFVILAFVSSTDSKTINLNSQGLTDFPSISDLSCTNLFLSHNKIQYIPVDAVCHLNYLKVLVLSVNRLVSLGNISCIGGSLEELYVPHNPIISIQNGTFDKLKILRKLALDYTSIKVLPDLSHLSSTLQHLSMDYLSLKLPHGYFEALNSLQRLFLQKVGLTQFPNMTTLYHSLTELYLRSNPLYSISLTGFTKLNKLILNDCQLTSIPFLDLPSLTYLDIGNNDFRQINNSQYEKLVLPKLNTIVLYHCKFSEIPLINSTSITKIDMRFINLSLIEQKTYENLKGIANLQTLDLDQSQLIDIPKIKHSALKTLLLSYIDLSKIDKDQFKNLHLPNLRSIKLEETKLRFIPNLENSNDNLVEIFLTKSEIQNVYRDDLQRYTSLKSLHLSESGVKNTKCPSFPLSSIVLSKNEMHHLPQLALCSKSVGLSTNLIKAITTEDAGVMSQITYLSLYSNPIQHLSDYMELSNYQSIDLRKVSTIDVCECQYVWLLKAMKMGANVNIDVTYCAGKLWHNHSVEEFQQNCTKSEIDRVESTTGWSFARQKAASCELPIYDYIPLITQQQCSIKCMTDKHCNAYKFKLVNGRNGDCQLTSGMNETVNTAPDGDDWNCYLVAPQQI